MYYQRVVCYCEQRPQPLPHLMGRHVKYMATLSFNHQYGTATAETFVDNRPAQLTFPKDWPDLEVEEHGEAMWWLTDSGYSSRVTQSTVLSDGRCRQFFSLLGSALALGSMLM